MFLAPLYILEVKLTKIASGMPRLKKGAKKRGSRPLQIFGEAAARAAESLGYGGLVPKLVNRKGHHLDWVYLFSFTDEHDVRKVVEVRSGDMHRAGKLNRDLSGKNYEMTDKEGLVSFLKGKLPKGVPMDAYLSGTASSSSSAAPASAVWAVAPSEAVSASKKILAKDGDLKEAMAKVHKSASSTIAEEAVAAAIETERSTIPGGPEGKRTAAEKGKAKVELENVESIEELLSGFEVEEVKRDIKKVAKREEIESEEEEPYEIYTRGALLEEPESSGEESSGEAAFAKRSSPSAAASGSKSVVLLDPSGKAVSPASVGHEIDAAELRRLLGEGYHMITFAPAPSPDEAKSRIIGSILELTESGEMTIAQRLEILHKAEEGEMSAAELKELGTRVLKARAEKMKRIAAKGFNIMSKAQLRKALSKL